MNSENKGMWFLPTRGRPESLKRFFEAYRATTATTPGRVIVDLDDISHYGKIDYPDNWGPWPVNGGCPAEAVKEGLKVWQATYGEPDWIGILTDDHIPETEHWDSKLLEQVKGWNVVSSNDGWQANADISIGRMHGATIWSGELVRAVGYLYPPNLKHLFFDDVWETIGRESGCWQVDMSVMVRHAHASKTGAYDAGTERVNSFWSNDEAVYRLWHENGKKRAVQKAAALMKLHDSTPKLPDLRGKSVLIATPTTDGQYDRSYMKAWRQTIQLLHDCGAEADFIEMPYMADVAMARNRLLGRFHRSGYTHLMMIDADMGWQPFDVVRLLQAQQDFVGAAGPMKKYPLTFCTNFSPRGVAIVAGMMLMEAEKVGGAFVMISRSCVERMISAYPELAFHMEENSEPEFALYDPLIAEIDGKRWRFGEDYSFCWRWRKIGGKIYVLPNVKLQHTGAHCFEGALIDVLNQPQQEAAE